MRFLGLLLSVLFFVGCVTTTSTLPAPQPVPEQKDNIECKATVEAFHKYIEKVELASREDPTVSRFSITISAMECVTDLKIHVALLTEVRLLDENNKDLGWVCMTTQVTGYWSEGEALDVEAVEIVNITLC